MTSNPFDTWHLENQHRLSAELTRVRRLLAAHSESARLENTLTESEITGWGAAL